MRLVIRIVLKSFLEWITNLKFNVVVEEKTYKFDYLLVFCLWSRICMCKLLLFVGIPFQCETPAMRWIPCNELVNAHGNKFHLKISLHMQWGLSYKVHMYFTQGKCPTPRTLKICKVEWTTLRMKEITLNVIPLFNKKNLEYLHVQRCNLLIITNVLYIMCNFISFFVSHHLANSDHCLSEKAM